MTECIHSDIRHNPNTGIIKCFKCGKETGVWANLKMETDSVPWCMFNDRLYVDIQGTDRIINLEATI